MKLITWNCNMVFRKKSELLLPFEPDIVVVPECENPERLKFPAGVRVPDDILWYGENPNKGLGVFSYSDYRFELMECHNPAFKNILPIAVTGGKTDFTLFAIWANNPADKDGAYVTQIWKAMQHYDALITQNRTILIGDFNSNTIWDKPRREGNHSALVEKLKGRGIHSTYHHYHNQAQGQEEHPTFFLYRHKEKPYHMDYCFASEDFISEMKSVEVGTHGDWAQYSDHKPLIIDFK